MSYINRSAVPSLASYKECTGCFACSEVCAKNAIKMIINEEGHYEVKVNSEKCVHCGKCETVCNNARKKYGCNDLSMSSVFAGYSEVDTLRENATSGGVFAAFAKKTIEDGGVVVGATFDGTYAKHIVINRLEDIKKLQGSKYTPSSMEGIYKIIERELPNRRVLFSGTGCQVAGILAYFENSKYFDNLFTIDIVCGGVPSIELIRRNNEHYDCKIVSFRNKDKYELLVENKTGERKVIPRKNLPLDGFAYEMTNRYSCYDCKFAFCHRRSDVTIGDIWDYSVLPDEHKKGVSLIIIHSERARKVLSRTPIYHENISWQIIKKNYRVAYGKGRIYRIRNSLANYLAEKDYRELEKVYSLNTEWSDFSLNLFKIYRHLLYLYDVNKRQKYIDMLLNDGK